MGLSTNILHLDRFRPDIFIDFPWDRGGYDENGCFFRASQCCANTIIGGHRNRGIPMRPWFFLKWNWGYRCPIDNLLVGGWEPWNLDWLSRKLGMENHPNWRVVHHFSGLKLPPTRYFFFDISHRWIMLPFTSNSIQKKPSTPPSIFSSW